MAVAALTAAGIATSTTTRGAAKPDNKGRHREGTVLLLQRLPRHARAAGGSGGLVNGTPAGGAEYLATHVKRLRAAGEAAGQKVITAGAGDLVGATPLVSAAFHDEPSIEALNLMRLEVSSVGNHEFDEGVTELKRLQRGGCHPTDGCQDGDGFDGADFPYLSANVVDKSTGCRSCRRSTSGRAGRPGRLRRHDAQGHPEHRQPGRHHHRRLPRRGGDREPLRRLLRRGIKSMVLLIHEGGAQNAPPTPQDPSSCANFAGPIAGIVAELRPEYGLVVSGHTHRFYSCALPNSSGANRWSPAPARSARWSPTSATLTGAPRSSPASPRPT